MYYPSSENKGADQLRSYCEAELRLCFRICRLLVFPWGGSNHTIVSGNTLTVSESTVPCELDALSTKPSEGDTSSSPSETSDTKPQKDDGKDIKPKSTTGPSNVPEASKPSNKPVVSKPNNEPSVDNKPPLREIRNVLVAAKTQKI